MEFASSMISSSGVFGPGEFATVLAIFKEIAAQPWFTRLPEKQQAFPRHILVEYRSGTRSIDQFRLACLAAAKMNFSEGQNAFSVVESQSLMAC